MRDASSNDVRRALDAGELLKRSELRERGWTDSMVARLLGEPDATLPNPHYRSGAPMRLYQRARVEALEATAAFPRMRDTSARRAARAKSVATRRAADLVETARAYVPSMPATLDYEQLLNRAIRTYNNQDMHERIADRTSDPVFLARVAWNYFRHRLTDWDETWDGFSGKPGVRDAYLVAAHALTTQVSARFPALRDPSTAWLERKRAHAVLVLEASARNVLAPAPVKTAE